MVDFKKTLSNWKLLNYVIVGQNYTNVIWSLFLLNILSSTNIVWHDWDIALFLKHIVHHAYEKIYVSEKSIP